MSDFLKRALLFSTAILVGFVGFAQDSLVHEKPQMAGLMRSNGKIYVVVTVLIIILAGLFLYLFQLDKKVTRLEQLGKK